MADLPDGPAEDTPNKQGRSVKPIVDLALPPEAFAEMVDDPWVVKLADLLGDRSGCRQHRPHSSYLSCACMNRAMLIAEEIDKSKVWVEHHNASIAEARLQGAAEATLNDTQRERLRVWRAEQDTKLLEAQRARGSKRHNAYHGAIGGSLTFQSTPTTLGTAIKVVYCMGTAHEAELDLTDYSDW